MLITVGNYERFAISASGHIYKLQLNVLSASRKSSALLKYACDDVRENQLIRPESPESKYFHKTSDPLPSTCKLLQEVVYILGF